MSKRPVRLCREEGQGLVELIVALTVLAIGIGALLTVLTSSALSLQRSGQKGTALTLAEKQIELYRNLSYADIRLDAVTLSSPSIDNVYKNSITNPDPNLPSWTGQLTDTAAGKDACDDTAPPPECSPIQYVGPGTGTATPDNRKYRIDTYIHEVTPNGGDPVAQVYVVVRNAQVSGYPILARSASTFSAISIANVLGKSIVTLSFSTQRAAIKSSTPDANAIAATLSGGSSETGQLTFYVMTPPSTPSQPCTGAAWQQVDSVSVSGDSTYHPSAAAVAAFPYSSTGTYYWYATYSGDPVNKKASSICGATMASTTVQTSKWSPALSLTSSSSAVVNTAVPGSSITATVASSSGYTPNTITLMAYGPTNTPPSSCTTTPSGLWKSAGSIAPNGNGSYSPSATFTPSATGRYWWYAAYPADTTNNAAASLCNGSSSIAHIDVTAPPDTFSVVPLSGYSQTAGAQFNVTITAMLPGSPSIDTGYTGAKTLSYSGPTTSPNGTAPSYTTSVTFTNGVATVPVTLFTAESAALTVTQGQVTGASTPITVSGTSTAGFSIASVGAQTAGTAFGITLTAVDAYGNASSYSGSHTIKFTGPGSAPGGQAPDYNGSPTSETLTFTSGIANPAGIKLYKAASTTLTATDQGNTTIKGSSQPFTVKGATPQTMTFVNCSKPSSTNTGCTGQPISVGNGNGKTMTANVGLLDLYGNAASATGAVTIDLSSSNTSKVTVTSQVNVPQGSTQSTQLTITTSNAPTTTITAHASAGGSFADVTLSVQS
jgi:type II secretory pathway pseudopilin PulG